jgi:hypothetical protein
VGFGSDIAGGYELGIQGVMRMSVAVSRLREGLLKRESQTPGEPAVNNPRIGWKESLYLATKGGAEAMGLSQGMFQRRSAVRRSTKYADLHYDSAVVLVGCITDMPGFHPCSPCLRSNDW